MNTFALARKPREAASLHADQHVGKMIMEGTHLLYSAFPDSSSGWKNHRCAVWARASLSNWRWLRELVVALASEHARRYGTIHGTAREHLPWLLSEEPRIPDVGLTPFALAMPEEFQVADPVESYRRYYSSRKRVLMGRPATWTRRPVPDWFSSPPPAWGVEVNPGSPKVLPVA